MKTLHLKYISYFTKSLITVFISLLLIGFVFFFKTDEIEISGLNIKIPNFIYHITEPMSIKVYLIYYFTMVFFANAVFLLLYSFIYHKIKAIQEKEEKNKMGHYTTLIVENIYRGCVKTIVGLEDFLGKEHFENLRRELKSNHSKKIFVDVLMKVHENVDGDLKLKLNNIFKDLELETAVKDYLLSPDFHDKIFAMRVMSAFNISAYNDIMLKYTKSKNEVLRTEAYVALIKVDSDPLEFLMLYPFNLSEWDKVLILNTILQNKKTDFQIEDLILAENTQVSSFAIFIAAKLKRKDLRMMILKKLNHHNINVRLNAITYIEEVPFIDDFKKLIQQFPSEELQVKNQIISAMRKCPDVNIGNIFLQTIIHSSETEPIKKFASDVSANISNIGFLQQ